MSVKKKTVATTINKYLSENKSVNLKLESLKERLTESDEIFKWRHFEQYLYTFIQGEKDIEDFYAQFIKLMDFYKNNPKLKSANTKEILQLKYGETLGDQIYEKYQKSNPFRNHKGRLSPFHKGSVNYSKETLKKAIKNRSYNTKLDYWLNKGLTEEEAKIALKERQTTFSLEKCIEKYGEIEGTKRWKERQDKWQNTLNSKSEEEKIKINMSKSSGKNNVSNKNGYCLLYYIRFYNNEDNFNVWKIGITGKSVEERFKLNLLKIHHNLDYEIKFVQKYESIDEAYSKEQYILNAFKENRVYTNYNGFSTTETFNKDVLEGFYVKSNN